MSKMSTKDTRLERSPTSWIESIHKPTIAQEVCLSGRAKFDLAYLQNGFESIGQSVPLKSFLFIANQLCHKPQRQRLWLAWTHELSHCCRLF